MEREVWGVNDTYSYDQNAVQTGIMVNGSLVAVEPGASFREVIKETSINAGFGKYRVLLNGVEIRPSEAPAVFASGDKAEVRAYDEAGVAQA